MIARRIAIAITAAIIAAAALAAPPRMHCLDAYEPGNDASAISPCGIWQVGADGAIFEVKELPGRPGCYTMVLLDGDDGVVPGGVFGTMELTAAKANQYDAELLYSLKGKGSKRKRNFIIEMNTEGVAPTLTFKHYNKGWVVNPLRLVPYLNRVAVHRNDTRPADADGAHRLSPPVHPSHITL